jgi:hypothetical protein
MPTLSRASLAALACPSAPLLAPRLLRAHAPLAAALPLRPWLVPTPARRGISDARHLKMVQHRKVQAAAARAPGRPR